MAVKSNFSESFISSVKSNILCTRLQSNCLIRFKPTSQNGGVVLRISNGAGLKKRGNKIDVRGGGNIYARRETNSVIASIRKQDTDNK